MPEWFLERDVKSTVILNDKLISDALLGNLPIKTEHSYSLNTSSTTGTLPDLPTTKMDGKLQILLIIIKTFFKTENFSCESFHRRLRVFYLI